MFKHFSVIIIFFSFICMLYGIFNISIEVENNACRMTYMFGQPQFWKIRLPANEQFKNYGLYYYYEGRYQQFNKKLNGAPVIFVPGNGGSYKQVRSLASVALRKALDNIDHVHMDYFTVDYNEELSGLYGGYLENQQKFLKICIREIIKLYANFDIMPKKVVIISHSMGGKVSQSLLTERSMRQYINSIIFISSPLDSPVVNFDLEMGNFYKYSNKFLSNHRISHKPQKETNVCTKLQLSKNDSYATEYWKQLPDLESILLISIGGGNRDLLVRGGLTVSEFSDVHAMTSSIPKVWLSCDHLSAVWCLQLVIVINRFLFNIATVESDKNVVFKEDKTLRLQVANNFFVKPKSRSKSAEVAFVRGIPNENTWHEDSRRVFKKHFKNGLRQHYNQLLQLSNYEKQKKLYIEVINNDDFNWLYGCTADVRTEDNIKFCTKGTSLAHHIELIPSNDRARSIALLDLRNIRKTYEQWTHILLRLPPMNDAISFIVDIYDPLERNFVLKAPRWFNFNKKYVINETLQGTVHYKIAIEDLDDATQTLELNIEPISCVGTYNHVITKLCVPWARGFNRYQILTKNENGGNRSIYVNVPLSSPSGYNTSINPVVMDVYLDPACRYQISYKFSIADTLSRTIQQVYHWLPAHLTTVFIVVLRNQISDFEKQGSFKFIKPFKGYFQYVSLLLVAGCRVFKKLLSAMTFLPAVDQVNYHLYVSVLLHSTAIVTSIGLSLIVWAALTFFGNIIYKAATRLTGFAAAPTSILVSVMSHMPVTFGICAVSVAISSCSGLALLFANIFYFIIVSNAYKDFLENFIYETATKLVFRKGKQRAEESSRTSNNTNPSNTMITNEEKSEEATQSAKSAANQDDTNRENKTPETRSGLLLEAAEDFSNGLQNFAFHITLLLLLTMVMALNFAVTIAWVKNFGTKHPLPDPALTPTCIIIICLSILLQLEAPNRLFPSKVLSVVLYFCAAMCIVYCQEAVYRINFIVASLFVIILGAEICCRLWKHFIAC